ncbi:hypothetical protein PCC7418_3796 [Halothece sp. PCC 7418]|uniref:hypothetical protein n=1 Tax=Halothece sp. (strain PCC 7418) TaxID=65093 RepID=UPI0002A0751A|nr:hypothetical protein [Halothece sp. PCC 7418]AFZ45900.1 hypothetical protein PCC7418_3796 [Halothece sp. PCC 7418]
MSSSQQPEKISIPSLPLAVYREIAAHLRQLDGIEVTIIPQSSSAFSYFQSQVEGLQLSYSSTLSSEERQYYHDILNYYEEKYGSWEKEN